MAEKVGYVVVEVNRDDSEDPYGLVPVFHEVEVAARGAAKAFQDFARQTGKNKNFEYRAAEVVLLDQREEQT